MALRILAGLLTVSLAAGLLLVSLSDYALYREHHRHAETLARIAAAEEAQAGRQALNTQAIRSVYVLGVLALCLLAVCFLVFICLLFRHLDRREEYRVISGGDLT